MSSEAALQRAADLEAQGHVELARLAYAEILTAQPDDARALNALGLLLYRTGSRKAAQIAFVRAANANPGDLPSHLNVAYTYVFESRFADARRHYELALEIDPSSAMAHQGLAYVLTELGEEDAAQRHRDAGFSQAVIPGTYRGAGEPVRVLVLCSSRGDTVSTSQFLDDRIFLVSTVVVELVDGSAELPRHDVVFNAIGDADRCGEALERASAIVRSLRAPVVNDPRAVLATARLENARRLRGIEGIVVPETTLFARSDAEAVARLRTPVLLRAPGFHTGRFFERVDTSDGIARALERLPGDHVLAIQFLDGRGADESFRKYRVIAVDGRLYPLHLAISRDWKVHYGTAQMDDPRHREEEQRFLEAMPEVLGVSAMRALERVVETLGLDYAGIDFGINAQGRVLFYEANATMTVVVPERHDAPYRRLPAERIIVEVMKMLAKRATSGLGVDALRP